MKYKRKRKNIAANEVTFNETKPRVIRNVREGLDYDEEKESVFLRIPQKKTLVYVNRSSNVAFHSRTRSWFILAV